MPASVDPIIELIMTLSNCANSVWATPCAINGRLYIKPKEKKTVLIVGLAFDKMEMIAIVATTEIETVIPQKRPAK